MHTNDRFTLYARIAGRMVGWSLLGLLALGILTAASLLVAGIVWSWR